MMRLVSRDAIVCGAISGGIGIAEAFSVQVSAVSPEQRAISQEEQDRFREPIAERSLLIAICCS
jgi:hypothetical protein